MNTTEQRSTHTYLTPKFLDSFLISAVTLTFYTLEDLINVKVYMSKVAFVSVALNQHLVLSAQK